ncbi:MAG: hypothetical protein PUC50_01340 [Bacteroidales bacterium]|nr:hypothetical protein [Bacteroidales bacterium]
MDIKELIHTACEDGHLSDFDRSILEQQAAKKGISCEELNKMIDAELFPPVPPTPASNKKRTHLIIIIAAVIVAAMVCLWFFKTKPEPLPTATPKKNDSTTLVNTHLQHLIQVGEDIFKTKNIARAKAHFVKILTEYPDNQDILKRINECDKIIKRSDYKSLTPILENGRLGFGDTEGYIVIDFLYDKEISRNGNMLLLKSGGKYGVVGGDLKTPTETKYQSAEWIAEEKSFQLIKNSMGDCDFVSVQNGQLIINEY